MLRVRLLTRQNIAEKVEFLTRCVNQAFFMERLHKRRWRARAWQGSSFLAADLKAGLGGTTGNYKKYMAEFFSFDAGNSGYSRRERVTKIYQLKPEFEREIHELWRGPEATELSDRDTGSTLNRETVPRNGVCRTSASDIWIAPLVEFSLDRLDAAIAVEESELGQLDAATPGYKSARRVRALRLVYRARKCIRTFGGIPNLYADYRRAEEPTSGSGRLHAIGDINLQSLPRLARPLLYKGNGWYDYDFAHCHYSILHSLCKAYKLETPVLDDYLEHTGKSLIDEMLGEELNLNSLTIKRVMNAAIYGQPLTDNRFSALREALGSAKVQQLRDQFYFLWLRDEIATAGASIIERHRVEANIVNALGKRRPMTTVTTTGAVRKVPARKLLSHVLLGYEAWALNIVCRDYTDIVALLFDGWVSPRRSGREDMSALIQAEGEKRFGVSLRISIKEREFAAPTATVHSL